jgi:hypothetical protein
MRKSNHPLNLRSQFLVLPGSTPHLLLEARYFSGQGLRLRDLSLCGDPQVTELLVSASHSDETSFEPKAQTPGIPHCHLKGAIWFP